MASLFSSRSSRAGNGLCRAAASVFAAMMAILICGAVGASTLEEDFQQPPDMARPYVWWHWMGPNFSKEGITKDLEAMKSAGIGGATIFNLTSAVQESYAPTLNNPWPQNGYRSDAYWQALRHAADEAERLRLEIGLHNTVGYSATGGPWIDESRSMQRLVWNTVEVEGGAPFIRSLPVPPLGTDEGWGKTGRQVLQYTDIALLAVPENRPAITVSDVLNLSDKLSPSGELRWNAPPPGRWTVYRVGHASMGRVPHPVPDDMLGKVLEADKMSLEQTRYHWDNVITPLRENLGPMFGRSFRHLLLDSYEMGRQSWTPSFGDEFQRRKGYDPTPWLVTLGPIIPGYSKQPRRELGGKDLTDRFESDYREVVAALYYENGWKPGADLVRSAGCQFFWEPYGQGLDPVRGAPLADLPMVEFWTSGELSINSGAVAAARAAGRKLIGAEAFTGRPEVSQWSETPAMLKKSADFAFAAGVNRMFLHHWVHQAFDDRYQPGLGMGWWGTHFGRNQTWFEPSRAFVLYLTRCQALLQTGETPSEFVSVGRVLGGGDAIPWSTFRTSVAVENGMTVLPSGRRYRFLIIPDSKRMHPADVERVGQLLQQGATIACGKPECAPGLQDYPDCDVKVRNLSDEIWGTAGETVRQYGAGTLYATGELNTAFQGLAIIPAAQVLTQQVEGINFVQRRDGDTDFWFVANSSDRPQTFTMSFAASRRQPELWDAERGTVELAPVWRDRDGRTEVELRLGADKSVFVVFRRAIDKSVDHLVSLKADADGLVLKVLPDGSPQITAPCALSANVEFASGRQATLKLTPPDCITIDGPWNVDFHCAVDRVPAQNLHVLHSLSESDTPSVRYFSGTATYRNRFKLPTDVGTRRISLDLGTVADMARVRLNGRDLGVLWHPPFVLDATRVAIAGVNDLEIAVTNTWHNRLVGDEREPADFELGTDRGPKRGRAIREYPDWFVKGLPRPSQGRKCFVIWYYHRVETPLLPSGLIGPVRVLIHPEPGQLDQQKLQQ